MTRVRKHLLDVLPPVLTPEEDALLARRIQEEIRELREKSDASVHQKLVTAGRAWLERRCHVVISEMASQAEEPDAIGWRHEGSILIECKASRADYWADGDKQSRTFSEAAMGRLRYYLVPRGLITPDEVYTGWGLLEWDGRWVRMKKESTVFSPYGWTAEMRLLISALRRVGRHVQDGDGCAVWAYKYQTKKRAVLGTDQTEDEHEETSDV